MKLSKMLFFQALVNCKARGRIIRKVSARILGLENNFRHNFFRRGNRVSPGTPCSGSDREEGRTCEGELNREMKMALLLLSENNETGKPDGTGLLRVKGR